jgi:Lrp/AsnC family transcriptional regulator, leucine-responsive regulatory protein
MTPDAAHVDEIDRQLLALLLEDARRSYAELGQRVGLSGPSVHARVKKMEERGVIHGYTVALDSSALGFGLAALVAVRQLPGFHWEQLEQAFGAMPAVEACWSVTGGESYLLQVRVSDPRSLEDLLREINGLEGVAGTQTSVILSTTFERRRIS